MSLHFHPLRIKDIRRETNECVSIAFEIPEALEPVFRFREGQNITVKAVIDGAEIRRSYSICSSPLEKELRIAVKAVPGGLFSQFANTRLKPGDLLELMPPTGKFNVVLDPAHKKQYLAFAAGSGITPILSIIKTILATEPGSEMTLVYGNRSRSSIIFREALEALKNKYLNRFRIIHVLSRERTDADINFGRIGAAKCHELSPSLVNWSSIDDYFICGPAEMIFSVRDYLLEQNIDPARIHIELFNTPLPSTTTSRPIAGNAGTAQTASVTIRVDGISFPFELAYDGSSILDAALQQGADLPYACKGGVCATCRAKLVQGEVSMDQNFALEPDELAAGFILTCQSHPRSKSITIDYDIR